MVAFIVFFALLFPFIDTMSSRVVKDSLIESTSDLIEILEKAGTEKELIQSLQKQEYFSFYRMSLINDKGVVIYDTHLSKLLKEDFKPYLPTGKREVDVALKKGVGYVVAQSDTFKGRFAYVAESFPFQGKTYILRTAFPYQQIEDFTGNFQIGVLIYSFLALLIFNALIWGIINRLTRPIRQIIGVIKSVPEEAHLPEIVLSSKAKASDDFQRLASAFNSLSRRIQEQIDVLKAERNEKEAILQSLGEGVIAVNEKMVVLYCNYTACKMLGLEAEEILEKSLQSQQLGSPLLEKVKDLLTHCIEKGERVTDSEYVDEASKLYLDLIAAPKAQGTGAILVLQDKTEHYRMLEMGKEFVANASHELRTPITIIRGYAETLHDIPDLPYEKSREITEKITRNCQRMENLVRSLLTLTDIENASEQRFTRIDLLSLIKHCSHTLNSLYPEASIRLELGEKGVEVIADQDLLELAILNLLDNAAKYSTPPAQIEVKLALQNDTVTLTIADRGKGIPKEDLPFIFQRFYRARKTHSTPLKGVGLGLAIVKTIIQKHHGTIQASSEEGVGTTITITLPVK